jgi:hypothetical protein
MIDDRAVKKEVKKDFRLSFEQHYRLTAEAARRGITPSNLLRQLIEIAIDNDWRLVPYWQNEYQCTDGGIVQG